MIHDYDRSGYIGASDVRYVMGRWQGKSFENWWREKLGLQHRSFQNRYMQAGNAWEHRILDSLGVPGLEKDNQFIREELKLRVNLDGNTRDRIYEVKTYQLCKGYAHPKWHEWQVQLQMFASGIGQGEIVAYGLQEWDYHHAGDVDPGRILRIPVTFDPVWLYQQYLPRHKRLVEFLIRRQWPVER